MYFYGIECVSVNFLIVFCASINKHIMGFSELSKNIKLYQKTVDL